MSRSSDNKGLRNSNVRGVRRSQTATLVLLSLIGFAGAIVLAWLAGKTTTTSIFVLVNFVQDNPLWWIEVPEIATKYLFAPTAILFSIVLVTFKLSPQPKTWSRAIVIAIMLALTIRYLLWRSLSSLNLDNPVNGIFSITLLLMEVVMLSSRIIQLFLMLQIKDRHVEANQKQIAVIEGKFAPTVDILIPTYNEPEFILRRTVIGCQAINYRRKKIYLLDDTRRPQIRKLAKELGCEYISRQDNSYAKAGNLNNAIAQTNSELIVVFDADFIPTTNFISRTIGFFQNSKIALVQTPQNFYNSDPIASNLGLENILNSEEEIFYRQIEPMRDGAGSVLCAGTSFVVRRIAIEKIGGFVTDSICEDYFTGICISAQGYELVYLNEKLSAGLAAENIADHINQRLRWIQGTLQAFFIDSNPLTIPGLRLRQRLAHLEGLLHWFNSIPRVLFLLMPLAFSGFGIEFIKVTFSEIIYFFFPYFLLQVTAFSWLNLRSRSAFISDIYSLVSCVPLALMAMKAMLNPLYSMVLSGRALGSKKISTGSFNVTPKGLSRKYFYFNWILALPLIALFIANAVSFWMSFAITESLQTDSFHLVLMWSAYNLFTISVALLTLVDIPKPDIYEWFDLRRSLRLIGESESYEGILNNISEIGAEIQLMESGNLPEKVRLEILNEDLQLEAKVTNIDFSGEFPRLRIMFEKMSLPQQRKLIEMLFCRPGQWRSRQAPGELQSLWLLLKFLLMPPILFNRNSRSTTAVNSV